ncbi:MAG: 5'-3' exoribonuclease [Candidatus Anoxychlamydiales bacterium]|nr:5'-3' exoribonuclease [Candidatus Anoxychlamydiales bacterium]
MDFRADLHMHSYFSDGTNSPQELLYLAKEKNLSAISITDHDTIDAYDDKLFEIADELGIRLLVGSEISSQLFNKTVHILAYGIDLHSKSFKIFLEKLWEKRRDRNIQILEKLSIKNIDISENDLIEFSRKTNISKTVLGRVHIAKLMIEKGYVKTLNEAFDEYIKDDGPCFVMGDRFTPKEVIDQIHMASGKAILAHPNVIKSSRVIDSLLEHDFDGIEVYYAKLYPMHEKKWLKIAEKKNLIASGGSDFHGTVKPFITIGCSWVDEKTFNKIICK